MRELIITLYYHIILSHDIVHKTYYKMMRWLHNRNTVDLVAALLKFKEKIFFNVVFSQCYMNYKLYSLNLTNITMPSVLFKSDLLCL